MIKLGVNQSPKGCVSKLTENIQLKRPIRGQSVEVARLVKSPPGGGCRRTRKKRGSSKRTQTWSYAENERELSNHHVLHDRYLDTWIYLLL